MKSQWRQLTVRFIYSILIPWPPPREPPEHATCRLTTWIWKFTIYTYQCAQPHKQIHTHRRNCAHIYELIDQWSAQNKYRWPAFFKNYVKSKVTERRTEKKVHYKSETEKERTGEREIYIYKERLIERRTTRILVYFFKSETTNHKKLYGNTSLVFRVYFLLDCNPLWLRWSSSIGIEIEWKIMKDRMRKLQRAYNVFAVLCWDYTLAPFWPHVQIKNLYRKEMSIEKCTHRHYVYLRGSFTPCHPSFFLSGLYCVSSVFRFLRSNYRIIAYALWHHCISNWCQCVYIL